MDNNLSSSRNMFKYSISRNGTEDHKNIPVHAMRSRRHTYIAAAAAEPESMSSLMSMFGGIARHMQHKVHSSTQLRCIV